MKQSHSRLVRRASNVIVHPYRDRERGGEIAVSLERSENYLRVYVTDDGVGMLPRLDSPGLGLWIPLISQLADAFTLSRLPEGGTEVCMRFALDMEAAA